MKWVMVYILMLLCFACGFAITAAPAPINLMFVALLPPIIYLIWAWATTD